MVKGEIRGSICSSIVTKTVTGRDGNDLMLRNFQVKTEGDYSMYVDCNFWGEGDKWIEGKLSSLKEGDYVKIIGSVRPSSYINSENELRQKLGLNISNIELLKA